MDAFLAKKQICKKAILLVPRFLVEKTFVLQTFPLTRCFINTDVTLSFGQKTISQRDVW